MRSVPAKLTMLAFLIGACAAAAAQDAVPTEVVLHKTGAGLLITDDKGMTLYTYDRDQDVPGQSACLSAVAKARAYGDDAAAEAPRGGGRSCAATWPPLAAPADARSVGDWSVIVRKDGSNQWAYRGKPLYKYVNDTYAGAYAGENVQSLWHVAFQPMDTPPQINVSETVKGRILTDTRGMALYTRDKETASSAPECKGQCMDTWVPVAAPSIAGTMGDWSKVDRAADGLSQWAYKGKPLYTYAGDTVPGEIRGDGVDKVWHAVVLDPPQSLPQWVTVRNTDMGAIFADAKGMTIYAFIGDLKKVNRLTCDQECVNAMWRPLVAPADAKPVGNWSVVAGKDGTAQWAFKGNLLYTFVQDAKPGDIEGDKYGSGYGKSAVAGGWWRPIVQLCMCSPAGAA